MGEVDKRGERVVLLDQAGYIRHKRTLAGQPIELVLRRKRIKRSLDQSAYAHSVPFALIAEHMGATMADAKLIIMGEKWGWHTVRGRELPVKAHTSDLTTAEFSELIDWMPIFAATELDGLFIPLPHEIEL